MPFDFSGSGKNRPNTSRNRTGGTRGSRGGFSNAPRPSRNSSSSQSSGTSSSGSGALVPRSTGSNSSRYGKSKQRKPARSGGFFSGIIDTLTGETFGKAIVWIVLIAIVIGVVWLLRPVISAALSQIIAILVVLFILWIIFKRFFR